MAQYDLRPPQAIAKTGKPCKVYMDIAGPKIRIKRIEAIKEKENLQLPVWEEKELVLRYDDHPIKKVKIKNGYPLHRAKRIAHHG